MTRLSPPTPLVLEGQLQYGHDLVTSLDMVFDNNSAPTLVDALIEHFGWDDSVMAGLDFTVPGRWRITIERIEEP